MKYTFLSAFLICIANILSAQVYTTGKVIDAESKAPIPFVNIGIKTLGIGTVSNDDGVFEIKKVAPNDILSFSSIGYETLDIKGSDLKNDNTIELTKKEYQIAAVEIQATRFNGAEKIFGRRNKTRGLSIGFGSRQLGTEVGALIKIDRPTYIKSANFVINHAKGDSMFFRVKIYDYRNGRIGNNLLTENILIIEKQKKGTLTIDLTPYKLILKNSVLLALEWLKNDGERGNSDLTFDTKKARKLKGVYIKNTSHSDFERLRFKKRMTPCFYFMGKQTD